MNKRYGFYHNGMLLRPLMREEAAVMDLPNKDPNSYERYGAIIQIIKATALLIGCESSADIDICEMVRDDS